MEAKTIIKRMSEEESNWFREFSRDTAMRDYNESMSIAKKEGLAEGERKKAVEAARNLLKMNVLSPEQIAQAEGLSLEQVMEIQKDLAPA